MTKGLLIFPSTITLAWAPSSVILTSRSIFIGIPKLTVSKSFFWFMLSNAFLKSRTEDGGQYHVHKIVLVFALQQKFDPLFSFVVGNHIGILPESLPSTLSAIPI
jgi:hypothetical protein